MNTCTHTAQPRQHVKVVKWGNERRNKEKTHMLVFLRQPKCWGDGVLPSHWQGQADFSPDKFPRGHTSFQPVGHSPPSFCLWILTHGKNHPSFFSCLSIFNTKNIIFYRESKQAVKHVSVSLWSQSSATAPLGPAARHGLNLHTSVNLSEKLLHFPCPLQEDPLQCLPFFSFLLLLSLILPLPRPLPPSPPPFPWETGISLCLGWLIEFYLS